AAAALLLLWPIWPPTVLYWPEKLTPPVRCTVTVTLSAVTLAVLLIWTCSSLNHGPLAATRGVTVTPPVPLVLLTVTPTDAVWVSPPPAPVTVSVVVLDAAVAGAHT